MYYICRYLCIKKNKKPRPLPHFGFIRIHGYMTWAQVRPGRQGQKLRRTVFGLRRISNLYIGFACDRDRHWISRVGLAPKTQQLHPRMTCTVLAGPFCLSAQVTSRARHKQQHTVFVEPPIHRRYTADTPPIHRRYTAETGGELLFFETNFSETSFAKLVLYTDS